MGGATGTGVRQDPLPREQQPPQVSQQKQRALQESEGPGDGDQDLSALDLGMDFGGVWLQAVPGGAAVRVQRTAVLAVRPYKQARALVAVPEGCSDADGQVILAIGSREEMRAMLDDLVDQMPFIRPRFVAQGSTAPQPQGGGASDRE